MQKNLESEGRLEETLIIVASDHGLTQTHSHFDSLEFMNHQGYKTFYYPNVFKHFTDADAASLISGNAMANIYVKSKDGWGRKSTFEELAGLVANFIERPEVDIVAGLDHKGRSRIKSTMGEAVTWLDKDGNINYQKIKGDPFNYNGMPKKMSSEEALAHSFNTEYPDALLQIIQLLESPRTGDLILSAGPGYDLRAKHENPEHRSSHGALFRDHMLVPLVMNAKVNKEFIRTVDIFPTILSFLGHAVIIKGDPFNYNGMPKKMSSEEALAHSFNTEYPDALLQIIQLLESPRTGDLILSAGPGYDLRAKHENPEHRSSHGALFRDHMLVPLVMNAKVNKEFIRTVDIFPTILSFLGQSIPNNIDGISLVD